MSTYAARKQRARVLAHQILGTWPGASNAEIQRAYKKLALRYHPDRHAQRDKVAATRRFQDIAEALAILIPPEEATYEDGPEPKRHPTTEEFNSSARSESSDASSHHSAEASEPEAEEELHEEEQSSDEVSEEEAEEPEEQSEDSVSEAERGAGKAREEHSPKQRSLSDDAQPPPESNTKPRALKPDGTQIHTTPYGTSRRREVPAYWSTSPEPPERKPEPEPEPAPALEPAPKPASSPPKAKPARVDGTTASTQPYGTSRRRELPSYWAPSPEIRPVSPPLRPCSPLGPPRSSSTKPQTKKSSAIDGTTQATQPYGTSRRREMPLYYQAEEPIPPSPPTNGHIASPPGSMRPKKSASTSTAQEPATSSAPKPKSNAKPKAKRPKTTSSAPKSSRLDGEPSIDPFKLFEAMMAEDPAPPPPTSPPPESASAPRRGKGTKRGRGGKVRNGTVSSENTGLEGTMEQLDMGDGAERQKPKRGQGRGRGRGRGMAKSSSIPTEFEVGEHIDEQPDGGQWQGYPQDTTYTPPTGWQPPRERTYVGSMFDNSQDQFSAANATPLFAQSTSTNLRNFFDRPF